MEVPAGLNISDCRPSLLANENAIPDRDRYFRVPFLPISEGFEWSRSAFQGGAF